MAYNYYTEGDPLLPKDKGAPEIVEEDGSDDDGQLRSRGNGLNNLLATVFGICFFASIFLVLLNPDGPLGDPFGEQRPLPRTMEERVDRVLQDTPLIGIYFCLVIPDWLLMVHRWAQRSSNLAEIYIQQSYLRR